MNTNKHPSAFQALLASLVLVLGLGAAACTQAAEQAHVPPNKNVLAADPAAGFANASSVNGAVGDDCCIPSKPKATDAAK